jgi:hypothetical protein
MSPEQHTISGSIDQCFRVEFVAASLNQFMEVVLLHSTVLLLNPYPIYMLCSAH